MRQSQTEIKAIEAELKSIRVERSPSRSVKLLDVNGKLAINGKEVEAPCPRPSTSASIHPSIHSSIHPSIHPITQNEQPGRSATLSTTLQEGQNQEEQNQDKPQESKQRRIECFPLPAHSSFEHPDDSMERNAAPASRPPTSRPPNSRRANSRHPSPQTATILSVADLEAQLAAISSPWQDSCSQEEFVPDQRQEPLREKLGQPSAGLQKQQFIQQLIEEKAKQINQLSSQQETAILELIQISDQIEPGGKRTKRQLKQESVQILECDAAEIPYVEKNHDGTLVLTHRPVHPSRSAHALTAQANSGSQKRPQQLRRSRSGKRHRWFYGIGRYGWRFVRGWFRSSHSARLNEIAFSRDLMVGEPALPYPQEFPVPSFSLQQAVLLVVASALVRFFLDQLVVIYPVLWFPSVVVMVLPAVLAVHRATVKPPVGFVWGYRLFAILIGLLLGGRL